MIKGQLTKSETNGYGYTTIWVSGTRYGSDAKGKIQANPGDMVEFDAFDKAGKDGRTWPTFKYQSFRTVPSVGGAEGIAPQAGSGVPGNNPAVRPPAYSGASSGRESYWADKEASDRAKDPRISYQASYERAILFTDLAIRNGGFDALAKAKPTARLGILEAFVAEQADKIMALVYAAKVPTPPKAEAKEVVAPDEVVEEADESWS